MRYALWAVDEHPLGPSTAGAVEDRLLFVGGGILDAPCDGTACKRGVKDAAPYAHQSNNAAINDHLP